MPQPFNPLAAPNPNNQHLQVMGWDFWPNQGVAEPAQQQLEPEKPVPLLIPLQPQNVQNIQPEGQDIQPEIAQDIVINVDGPVVNVQVNQNNLNEDGQVLAMDVLIDASDNEPEPPLLPIDPVEIVPLPNFDNLEPLMLEEVQIEDLLDYFHGPEKGA